MMPEDKLIRAGIIGASGYAGAETMRILWSHPEISVTLATAREYAGVRISELYPSLEGFYPESFSEYSLDDVREKCDVVFLGLPNGQSMRVVPGLLDEGVKVVDLSPDFRFADAAIYEAWYGPHSCPGLLGEAVYGLPEANRNDIAGARLVANPGCYPTGALLGLLPLAKAAGIEGTVVVDAKSGVSGAGRKPTLETHLPQAADSISPYAVAGHRHLPEMTSQLACVAGAMGPEVVFTPHLTPMNRGILCTIYVPLAGVVHGISDAGGDLLAGIRSIYETAYDDEPFVSVLPTGRYPQTKAVQGSNNCQVGLELAAGGKVLVVMTVIDNLVKGAAGQAVQSMNIMCGLQEDEGLAGPGIFP